MLKDRFGSIPNGVQNLTETVKLRWKAIELGFERISIKNSKMRCYISDQKSPEYFQSENFGNILTYVKSFPKQSQMKEVKNKLLVSISEIEDVDFATKIIDQMLSPSMTLKN